MSIYITTSTTSSSNTNAARSIPDRNHWNNNKKNNGFDTFSTISFMRQFHANCSKWTNEELFQATTRRNIGTRIRKISTADTKQTISSLNVVLIKQQKWMLLSSAILTATAAILVTCNIITNFKKVLNIRKEIDEKLINLEDINNKNRNEINEMKQKLIIDYNQNQSNVVNHTSSSTSFRRHPTAGPWMDHVAALPCVVPTVSNAEDGINTSINRKRNSSSSSSPPKSNTTSCEGINIIISTENNDDDDNNNDNDDKDQYDKFASTSTFATKRYISRWGNTAIDNNNVNDNKIMNPINNNNVNNNISNNENQKQEATVKNLDDRKSNDNNNNNIMLNEYPNLKRHHPQTSLIRRYLTKELYNQYQSIKTSQFNVTFDDMIKAGIALPYGNLYPMPHQSVGGIYVGDPECYTTYQDFLLPIIKEYHYRSNKNNNNTIISHISRNSHNHKLQRHVTNLNPKQLIQKQLDIDGQFILFTKMRLARSIVGYPFPISMNRKHRNEIQKIIKSCTEQLSSMNNNNNGYYKSIMDMTNKEHVELIQKRILFNNPDEFLIVAGFGNDWPDGRGIYCNNWDYQTSYPPNIIIWCNVYDHIWIISTAKGGNVQQVFTSLSETVTTIENILLQQPGNHKFVEDDKLGFLNSSPADIGTALRASVTIKLVRLGQLSGFNDMMLKQLHLHAKPQHLRSSTTTSYNNTDEDNNKKQQGYTGIFDISNIESLGQSEVDLINILINGIGKCIELEKRLENGESIDLNTIQFDK